MISNRNPDGMPVARDHAQGRFATLIFERLKKEHGYPGGYDQVRRYVAAHRRIRRETFLPLEDAPGQRMEADFGHIHVDFPEDRRLVPTGPRIDEVQGQNLQHAL